MDVVFSGKYAENTDSFGVNFEALVDGDRVVCIVSPEALDDIQPLGRLDDVVTKYQANKADLERVARRKILEDCVVDGKVYINQADVL